MEGRIGDYMVARRRPPLPGRKTSRWNIENTKSGTLLGTVEWYGPWRQFCFLPNPIGLVFSAGCLNDLRQFVAKATADHRAAPAKTTGNPT
jgi:hypothetical protein